MNAYTALECGDDLDLLQKTLTKVAEAGGRVISVTWQPARTLRAGSNPYQHPGGFTIIVEESRDP
jgi:hypothetical protein